MNLSDVTPSTFRFLTDGEASARCQYDRNKDRRNHF